MIKKIISGGQTGADQGGLEAGKALNLETGGVIPKGFRTDTGPNPSLVEFGLIEHESWNYAPRTILNVKNSDGTVWFGKPTSPGAKLTLGTCKKLKKPNIINPTKFQLIDWIIANKIETLNVAGNREKNFPGLQARVKFFLTMVFSSQRYKDAIS